MMSTDDVFLRIMRGADPATELDRWADQTGARPEEIVERLLGVAPRGRLHRPVVEWCFRRVLAGLPPAVHASTAALFCLVHWLEGHPLRSATTAISTAYGRTGIPAPRWLGPLAARAAAAAR